VQHAVTQKCNRVIGSPGLGHMQLFGPIGPTEPCRIGYFYH
jgi:hypothetical protein